MAITTTNIRGLRYYCSHIANRFDLQDLGEFLINDYYDNLYYRGKFPILLTLQHIKVKSMNVDKDKGSYIQYDLIDLPTRPTDYEPNVVSD